MWESCGPDACRRRSPENDRAANLGGFTTTETNLSSLHYLIASAIRMNNMRGSITVQQVARYLNADQTRRAAAIRLIAEMQSSRGNDPVNKAIRDMARLLRDYPG